MALWLRRLCVVGSDMVVVDGVVKALERMILSKALKEGKIRYPGSALIRYLS